MEVNDMAMIAIIGGNNRPKQTLAEYLASHNNGEAEKNSVKIHIPGENTVLMNQVRDMIQNLAACPPEIEFVETPPYSLVTEPKHRHMLSDDVLRRHCSKLKQYASIGGDVRK